jgi:hypothetical protein
VSILIKIYIKKTTYFFKKIKIKIKKKKKKEKKNKKKGVAGKKISLFIYFLINLYFFIKMDTCRHLIGLTWHLIESVKKFN